MKTYMVNSVECILVGVAFDETTENNRKKLEAVANYARNYKVITYPTLLHPKTHEPLPLSVMAMDVLDGYYKGVFKFCLPVTEKENFLEWRKTQNYKNKQPYRTGENEEIDNLFNSLKPWTREIQDI